MCMNIAQVQFAARLAAPASMVSFSSRQVAQCGGRSIW